MAIAKMKKFLLITLKSNLNETMKKLQASGIVQIESAIENNSPNNEIIKIENELERMQLARTILDKFPDSKHDGSAPPENIVDKILNLNNETEDFKNRTDELKKKITDISPYISFDGPLKKIDTETTESKLVYADGIYTDEQLQEILKDGYYEILNHDQGKTYLWVLYPKNSSISSEFSDLGINSPMTPSEYINFLRSEIKETEDTISVREKELMELSKYYDSLTDKNLLMTKELLEEKEKLFMTESTAIITGYVLKKDETRLLKTIDNGYIEFSDAGEDAPVAFKNNFFVSPVEGITESYTMPSRDDIDPNPVMAFFYYLFFGMMFSDAGYGLLMIAVCGYVGFLTDSKIRKMMQMFFFCGISTLFWGLMYGSFFGNAITSIGETFLGRTLILRPLWINPTSEPLTLLIFSIALGFIQILTGLTIKMYVQIRQGNLKSGIFDTGSWIVTLAGLGILSAGIVHSPLISTGIILTLSGVIMLILTQGRTQKNIFLKLSSGVLSLYDITSYISDILSYSRLMALGLATGVIAQVVNILGALGGKTITGAIMYIAVFIIGHGLNFAINMLGAYVHTNRLQYVEFYSKFYEGGGRAFVPFGRRYN